MKKNLLSAIVLIASLNAFSQMARFEKFVAKKDTSLNALNGNTHFDDAGFNFLSAEGPWGSWLGFTVSSHTDTVTADYTNQYSAYTGSGLFGTNGYLVAYSSASIS
ncbi:MAG: DUF4465 domain-containing protein, partial [Bacteroidetes bacterium]|nr:DUF4465 domain-containing protein [Bacteroidota bacterium]